MDRGTQADADDAAAVADPPVIDKAPSSVATNEPTNNELFRNANISVTNQKLLNNGGDNSSVDSLHSADSAKRDGEEPAIELAEIRQPMITKDEGDGIMSNGDGKNPGVGGKPSNGNVKEQPVDDDVDRPSCGMECLYFAMQCCECSIM